ncbi:MAG: phenylalanine--tRNA ligase subunit beta, partial [Lachnospiraceae bacterium]|nr:phenylalanine--tRNA ligase subunit beta [Lachnospiraceae bacterium]
LSGSHVENAVYLDKNLENIVVGRVESIEKHPDADKLIVCQVDVGEKKVQIVTGAPNVTESALIPVVLDGGRVAGGHDGGPLPEDGIAIHAGKLRGVESAGMMCSIEELGSSRDFYPDAPEDGLYILPEDAPVGADAPEYLGLRDVVFEYEITSNRVDCYSVLGIAREAAATFEKPFCPPEVKVTGNSENAADYISVRVEDTELCPRFCARVVKNVKIGPSPAWMQRRLAASGIRPINNLVDITNYVMEEYGQPMHAYDLSTIRGRQIVVRRANDGDTFTTLDGQERKLDKDVLMICDGDGYVGIAGIMGGENSMITDDVHEVLFEAANFDGTNVRLSAKRIGLRTEASGKFEKGLDPNNASAAIDRACQLIEELGCGEVVGGMVDSYPVRREPSVVKFSPEKANELLGTDVSREEMHRIFERIELDWDEEAGTVTAPTFRQDIGCQADLAEEVARFFGYANIPTTLPAGEATTGKNSFGQRVEAICRDIAEYCGFSQAMTYSFESPRVFEKLRFAEGDARRAAVKISNPLGEDYSIMRTSAWNGMLQSLGTNYSRRNKNVRLYELAKIYLPKALPLTELPDERTQLILGAYGEIDFFEMKGVLEELLERLGMRSRVHYDPAAGEAFLHPGRQARVFYEGREIGVLGEVHPQVAETYGIGERAVVMDLDLPVITEMADFDRKYLGLARFPAVTRDLSMVVPHEVLAGQIEDVFEKQGGKLLESFSLFDIYEGAQILAGFKSMAYSLTLRAADHTLEEKEVSAVMDRILAGLRDLGIELRA